MTLRKLLFGISVCAVILITVFFFLLVNRKETVPLQNPFPTPTPFQNSSIHRQSSADFLFSPFQKTIIGKTTDAQIATLSAISNQPNPDGSTTYLIKSVNPLKPDEIITRNNVVISEKTNTITNKPGGFPKISELKKTFGNPEQEITGSKEFGDFAITYIYPQGGFSFVGNPATDNVYQILRFQSMNLKEYVGKYGSVFDISPIQSEGQ